MANSSGRTRRRNNSGPAKLSDTFPGGVEYAANRNQSGGRTAQETDSFKCRARVYACAAICQGLICNNFVNLAAGNPRPVRVHEQGKSLAVLRGRNVAKLPLLLQYHLLALFQAREKFCLRAVGDPDLDRDLAFPVFAVGLGNLD